MSSISSGGGESRTTHKVIETSVDVSDSSINIQAFNEEWGESGVWKLEQVTYHHAEPQFKQNHYEDWVEGDEWTLTVNADTDIRAEWSVEVPYDDIISQNENDIQEGITDSFNTVGGIIEGSDVVFRVRSIDDDEHDEHIIELSFIFVRVD